MEVSEIEALTVVRLNNEEVRDGRSIQSLRNQLYQLVDGGHRKFAVDFKDVREMVASAVIALLLNLRNRLKMVNGSMTLHAINPQVYEVFQVTRLDTVFDIRPEPAPEGGVPVTTHLPPPAAVD